MPFFVEADTPVVVAVGIVGVDLQGSRIVIDGSIYIADPIVSEASVEIGFEIVGVAL